MTNPLLETELFFQQIADNPIGTDVKAQPVTPFDTAPTPTGINQSFKPDLYMSPDRFSNTNVPTGDLSGTQSWRDDAATYLESLLGGVLSPGTVRDISGALFAPSTSSNLIGAADLVGGPPGVAVATRDARDMAANPNATAWEKGLAYGMVPLSVIPGAKVLKGAAGKVGGAVSDIVSHLKTGKSLTELPKPSRKVIDQAGNKLDDETMNAVSSKIDDLTNQQWDEFVPLPEKQLTMPEWWTKAIEDNGKTPLQPDQLQLLMTKASKMADDAIKAEDEGAYNAAVNIMDTVGNLSDQGQAFIQKPYFPPFDEVVGSNSFSPAVNYTDFRMPKHAVEFSVLPTEVKDSSDDIIKRIMEFKKEKKVGMMVEGASERNLTAPSQVIEKMSDEGWLPVRASPLPDTQQQAQRTAFTGSEKPLMVFHGTHSKQHLNENTIDLLPLQDPLSTLRLDRDHTTAFEGFNEVIERDRTLIPGGRLQDSFGLHAGTPAQAYQFSRGTEGYIIPLVIKDTVPIEKGLENLKKLTNYDDMPIPAQAQLDEILQYAKENKGFINETYTDQLNAYLDAYIKKNDYQLDAANVPATTAQIKKTLLINSGFTYIPYINTVESRGDISYWILSPEFVRNPWAGFRSGEKVLDPTTRYSEGSPVVQTSKIPLSRDLLYGAVPIAGIAGASQLQQETEAQDAGATY